MVELKGTSGIKDDSATGGAVEKEAQQVAVAAAAATCASVEQVEEYLVPNCMRRLRAALGAAAESGPSEPEVAALTSGAGSAEETNRINEEAGAKGGESERQVIVACDEQEGEDELTSLPDTVSLLSNKVIEQTDNNGNVDENEIANEHDDDDDDQIQVDDAASCGYYSKQFNRLDPSRRSFSSPAVNLILFGAGNLSGTTATTSGNKTTQIANVDSLGAPSAHQVNLLAQGNHNIMMKQYNDKGNNVLPAATADKQTTTNSYSSKLALQQKQRRRTALGLISFGSNHFRMSSSASPNTAQVSLAPINQKQATTTSTWRTWFSGGGGGGVGKQEAGSSEQRKQSSRKFLLRSLRPQQQQQQLQTSAENAARSICGQRKLIDEGEQVVMATSNGLVGKASEQDEEAALHVDKQPTKSGAERQNLNKSLPDELTGNHHLMSEHRLNEQDTRYGHRSTECLQRSAEEGPVESSYPAQTGPPNNIRFGFVDDTCCCAANKQSDSTSCRHEQTNLPKLIEVEESSERLSQQPLTEALTTFRPTDVTLRAPEDAPPSGEDISLAGTNKDEDRMGQLRQERRLATAGRTAGNDDCERPSSLVDRLIDSELEWRQLIREANEQLGKQNPLINMSELQIKRQEVIHELVQTERHHCLTLALMRQVYLVGLRQLNEWRSMRDMQSVMNTSSQQLIKTTMTTASNTKAPFQNQTTGQLFDSQLVAASGDLIDLERLFPALEDLIQAHELFFAHLRLRLVESCQQDGAIVGLVGPLGDLLCDQFRLKQQQRPVDAASGGIVEESSTSPATTTNTNNANNNDDIQKQTKAPTKPTLTGEGTALLTLPATITAKLRQQQHQHQQTNQPGNGHKLLQAYAKFCGQHYDSSRYYKQLMQSDKGFKQFIEACEKQNPVCRQRGIPECNLLVTQRLTKYPLLIEQLIKTSKGDPDEENRLQEALRECKSLLNELNQQLARKESFERLLDIYARFCPKSYTIYNRHLRFTKHDLLQHKRVRQLIHSDSSIRIWSATRRKLFQVLCLILNDIVVFLRVEASSSSSSSSLSSTTSSSSFPNSSPSLHFYQHQVTGNELCDTSALEQQQSSQQQQQMGPISQCALINVVASALHSAGATHSLLLSNHSTTSHHHPPTGSNQQQQLPCLTGTNHHHHHQPANSTGANNQQVKYYFANIDNKSSVISLSKLLIREKAVQDGEPRIYLISSSPRQPEMYELAFVSKRHQTGFVEKLKGCIEVHNRNKEMMNGYYDYDDDEEEEDVYDLVDHTMYDDDGDHEEEEEEDDDDDGDEDDECSEDNIDDSESNDNNIHGDDERGVDIEEEASQVDHYGGPKLESREEIRKACTGNLRDCHQCRSSERRYRQQQEQQQHKARRRQPVSSSQARSAGYYELDIEQDIVLPPKGEEDDEERQQVGVGPVQGPFSSPEAADSSLSVYATPAGCIERQQVAFEQESVGAKVNAGDSCSELDSDRDDERRLASTESGLSERAKDSLDETAPSKQKLRNGRRRRAQRPRNVSNQSSSSSEAAHRQAIKLIAAAGSGATAAAVAANLDGGQTLAAGGAADEAVEDYEFDSGRGQDDSSSTSSNSNSNSNSLAARSARAKSSDCKSAKAVPAATVAGVTGSPLPPPAKRDSKLIDLKLFRDTISLSTSSITSTLMGSLSGGAQAATSTLGSQLAATPPTATGSSSAITPDKGPATPILSSCASSTASGRTFSTATASAKSTTTSSSSSCSSSAPTTTTTTTSATQIPTTPVTTPATTTTTTSKSNLVKCSSILGSSCSFIKQRKLSTVSSMSHQLKQLKQQNQDNMCQFCATTGRNSSHHHHRHVNAAATAANTYLCNGAHQSSATLSKQVRQQMRRSSFIPEQKLEELRDLRIQLDKDKQEWQAKFDRMQEQLLNERRELDLAREKIKLDRQQVANEREQLYRKLDLLKEKGILLSPSHKVIITTPESRIYPPNSSSSNNNNNALDACNQVQNHHHYQHQTRQILRNLNSTTSGNHINNNNNNYQQQHYPLTTTSSVRIVQQQPPQPLQQVQQQHQQLVAINNKQSTTNLFIQSSPTCKVPHHLSEHTSRPTTTAGGLVAGGRAALNLLSERLVGGGNVNQGQVESHVI